MQKNQTVTEEINRSRSAFIADMSHEIRTPMNAITGMSEIALREDLSDTARECLLTIKQASARLLSVINQVFDLGGEDYGTKNTVMFTAADASVLVVDDINTNLSVAHGLLLPYKMRVDLCNNGIDAIEAVKSTRYDLVFMDHMMPEMNGIEVTSRIRKLGASDSYYATLPIVALTANAAHGAKEMFLKYGFNDYLSKPIDTINLNSVLSKWIPKEKQVKSDNFVIFHNNCKNPKLLKVFYGDAEKAVLTLRETAANGNIKLFTTTAHAMKSALANIGETEISELAFALEKAGQNGDTEFIAANTDSFINTLEMLVKHIEVSESSVEINSDFAEDTAYLKEQLLVIKEACENYDCDTAYAALDRLEEKPWKFATAAAIEKIRNLLFLCSDFEEAGEYTIKTINSLNTEL